MEGETKEGRKEGKRERKSEESEGKKEERTTEHTHNKQRPFALSMNEPKAKLVDLPCLFSDASVQLCNNNNEHIIPHHNSKESTPYLVQPTSAFHFHSSTD